MIKFLSIIIIITILTAPTMASEKNFLSEFEVTLFQTFPFVTMWGYFLDQQVARAGSPHWNVILSAATVISVVNAISSAREQVKNVE